VIDTFMDQPEDAGDAASTALIGLVGLTVTRLVTRSMDRADARRTVTPAG